MSPDNKTSQKLQVLSTFTLSGVIPGTPTLNHITRGCQALRYGATCEDIFNELRANNEILPGQHVCTTCSTDLCNASDKINAMPPIVALVVGCLCWFIFL